MKLTNKHNGILVICGLAVRPGATVEVDNGKFAAWEKSHGAKIWLKAGIVAVEGKQTETKTEQPEAKQEKTEWRQELENRAYELGVEFRSNISDEKLEERIGEAEAALEAEKAE